LFFIIMVSITTIAHVCEPGIGKSRSNTGIILNDDIPKAAFNGLKHGDKIYVVLYHHHHGKFDLWSYGHSVALSTEQPGIFANLVFPRPNNLEVVETKVEKVEDNILWVLRIDVMPGTPVIDVQPINRSVHY
ncbi:MAG: TrmO family methyltransferase, partial [Cyclobacteriaceae bacterium]